MAEPASDDLRTVTHLSPRFSAGPDTSAENHRGAPPPCQVIGDDEKFIRLMIQLALEGERITGASEEGGNVTTAEEKSDPFHVPLPDEVPVHNRPESSPE